MGFVYVQVTAGFDRGLGGFWRRARRCSSWGPKPSLQYKPPSAVAAGGKSRTPAENWYAGGGDSHDTREVGVGILKGDWLAYTGFRGSKSREAVPKAAYGAARTVAPPAATMRVVH